MPTPVFACGGECQADVVGTQRPHFTAAAGTPVTDTTIKRAGVRSWKFLNNSESIESIDLANSSLWVGRCYIYFVTLPTANCQLMEPFGMNAGPYFRASDSKIYSAYGSPPGSVTFGATGVGPVTTGTWYLLETSIDASANPWPIKVRLDGVDAADASKPVASAAHTRITFGINGSSVGEMYIDDILISQTLADYPLGAGYVLSYIPNADGTHNIAGANDFERTLTGTDITNATTDAWVLIDDRPLPSTAVDFINGIAPPNATDYVEWQYEDSVEANPPRAVEGLITHHDASGAGTNDFTVTLREHAGSTSGDIWTGTTNVGAVISYKRALFATVPGTSDPWTTTKFNALRSRFLVADASPDPYIDAAMLEVEFPGGTTLYLTNTASDLDLGVETEYKLALTRGDAAVSEIGLTAGGAAVIDDANGTIFWYSAALNAVTISGTITINLRMAEEFATTNYGAMIDIAQTDGAGTVINYLLLFAAKGTEMGTAEAAQNWSVNPTSLSFSAGDRLQVTIRAAEVGTGVDGDDITFWFDGPTGGASGDSFLTFTETITEQSGAAAAAYAWPRLTIRKNRRILL